MSTQRTFEYLVYRKGSNAANQPREFDWAPVAIVRAASAEKACETSWHGERPNIHGCPTLAADVLVSAGNLDFWPNQYARAVLKSRAPKRDIEAVLEAATWQVH